MKKKKSIVALVMIFVLVVALGRFVSASEVKAASVVNSSCGATVTIKNAQLVTNVPQSVQDALGISSGMNARVYVSNDATAADVQMTGPEGRASHAYFSASSLEVEPTQLSEGTGWILEDARVYIGQDMKTLNANMASMAIFTKEARGGGIYEGICLFSPEFVRQLGISVEGTSADGSVCTMNRLYNPNSGEHFYTANNAEKDHLVSLGWKYESTGWTAPACSGTPVYRLYNPNAAERDNLTRQGWKYEGTAWYGL